VLGVLCTLCTSCSEIHACVLETTLDFRCEVLAFGFGCFIDVQIIRKAQRVFEMLIDWDLMDCIETREVEGRG
jgi:hypothetical protein